MNQVFWRRWLTAGVLLVGQGIALAETLVIFGDDSYAPVVYIKDGKPAGILPTVLQHISTQTGDTYDIRLSPWKRAYEMAARGDGGVVGVSLTTERTKVFDFSKAIYDDDIQIVALKGKTFPYARLEDLKGKVIGGVNGASYGEMVDRAIAQGLFTVERDVGQVGRLRKLLAGRLDAAFIGNGSAGFERIVSATDELRNNRDKFVVLLPPLAKDALHLAFPKSMNQRAALERFDTALEKLRKSGELRTLIQKAN